MNSKINSSYFRKSLQFRYIIKKLVSLYTTSQNTTKSRFARQAFRERFYRNLWSSSAKNLDHLYEDLGYGYWRVKNKDNREVRGNLSSIGIDSEISIYIAGNKPLCHRLAKDIANYRAPRHCEFDLDSLSTALDFMQRQNTPCVVKPAWGTGAGSGVTTGISTLKHLIRSTINASVYNKKLLIEETIPGHSYRLLFLNGHLLQAIRRDPPQVVGNGHSTIKQLIDDENLRRISSSEIISLFPIIVDQECTNSLKRKLLSLSDIPEHGKTIIIKEVVNQNAAEQNVDITSKVHPSIIKTSLSVAKRVNLQLSGVDVISPDISCPLAENGGIISEINAKPGLHHHYLTSNNEVPTFAEEIIEYCFSNKEYCK